ncbi:glycoside hydrolase family 9 protein [Chitinophaga eiseniae]|uniref:Endoglucanase n=1 Tax=Chitinophaga eiseniae TaxID=634771 RepID=A0A847SJB7_9BACT|nr:glycoside hydrolase family 9 protein [Chitinophaga eiseniae]NLR79853.1 cellulase [Chitinophaga eiseniae]
MLGNKSVFAGLPLLLGGCLHAQQPDLSITLNQAGFYPHAPKIAVVTQPVKGDSFYITPSHSQQIVFRGRLGKATRSVHSSTTTRIADFSAFTTPGDFVVVVPGAGQSPVFPVNAGVYHPVAVAALKGYYYQRSNIPLEARFAGQWHRPAGHPDTAVLVHPGAASATRPAGTVIATPGGWYDAGDYNKYIVNSGITMGTLLSAYEDFPGYFKQLNTNIPESGDALPDILNEAVYNLQWMLTMQDPADGGVYNKCTNADFDGMVMPGVTKAPRYVVQKGTAATLDFAAVTAQAARILQPFNPALATQCREAAGKAWQWALQHPALRYDQDSLNKVYQPAITTGGYGDRYFADEWLWAASELYITTRDPQFFSVVEKHIGDPVSLPSWANVGMLGYYSLLRAKDLPASTATVIQQMKERVLALANQYVMAANTSAFHTVMGQSPGDFIWGSSSVAANQGIVLLNAYRLTRDRRYAYAALGNLDYLLGRNATTYCFVTGIGSKSPLHPHHRLSIADGITAPVPGLLVGGPNPGRQDKSTYEFTEPETAYTDKAGAYASNEIAINWNAPLVYLVSGIDALKEEVGYL